MKQFLQMLGCLWIGTWPVLGQLQSNGSRQAQPYQAVFLATDAVDTTYLSVLEKAFNQARHDTLRLTLVNDLAYYWHTRNLDSALAFAQKGLALARTTPDKRWLGRLQITEGAILLRQEKLDQAWQVLQTAKQYAAPADLPFLNTQLGYVMERRGQLGKAADYALESLRLGRALNDQKAIALAYSDLSNLFWKQGKGRQGLAYGLKSEVLFKKCGIQDLDYDFTLYVVGNNYLMLNQYTEALRYYEAARQLGEQYGFYNNLADIYISLTELYTALKQYDKATDAAANAIKYSTRLGNDFLLMRSWLSIGKLQNLTHQPARAVTSLNTCLRVATDAFGDKYFLHQAYYELAKAQADLGNYKQANDAFLRYDQLKDSLFTVEADQRIAKLQTQFNVAQKEVTITRQQGSLAQQRKLQLLTFGILGLLAIVLISIYRNNRASKRTNQTLALLNTNLEQKNALLDKRNAENELLLKEIHHRVKNNLEVVSSLLALQAAQIGDPGVQAVMQASQNRVHSMGIIHQKLYQGENLSVIEMRDYFSLLAQSTLDSFGMSNCVQIDCPMPPLKLDIDTAITVGLITNELLTNSLKYAFVGRKTGLITVSLTELEPGALLLRIADNGIGKHPGYDTTGTGFGTQLVELLTRQLDGTLRYENRSGTRVSLRFGRAVADSY